MENKQKTYSFISFPKITTRPCFQFSTTFLLFTLSAPPLSSSLSRFTSSSSSSTRTTTTTFDAEMVMGSSNSDLANLNSSGAMGEPSISCTTFNILAPIYKRLDQQKNQNTRESDFRAFWFSRNQRILDWLLYERSSIICLQEFWVGNEELVHMYQERLGDAGYITFKLARTNNRGDGKSSSDWNGSKRGHVYKFLRSQGFVSSYDIAHQYTDSDADAHKWVSHRNHRGNICGVDFIWLRNPSKSRKPLKTSWAEAVFGIIKYQLRKASSAESDAFQFLRADNHANVITYSDFCEALQQVNLTGLSYGLSFQEIKDLWTQADTDGNGVLDYEEFKRIWNSTCSEQTEENYDESVDEYKQSTEEAIGFRVKSAVLLPHEVERGMWPENYTLSDHARLTVEFSPVRMQCSS
ncbi:uncharacterized calcium-binding protein At1g02270-like [Carica papaya]|uniref:uncharacterized calcium-binding protein At1g02270-like n=1 Tax=Carica papaya TaxID=3649 RepID=UPI000B8CA6B5|nr:uncharacterized calcium-binding protein At1g02270-like [Carica papaya]